MKQVHELRRAGRERRERLQAETLGGVNVGISARVVIAAVSLLACTGCTLPTSKYPLVDPAVAKPMPELHGAYRSTDAPDNIVHYAHVGPAGDGFPEGFLRIVSVGQPKDAKTELTHFLCVAFVERVGRHHVLHIPLPKTLNLNESAPWPQKWDPEQVGGYHLVRLTKRDDGGIEMAGLNESFLAKQIDAKQLAGRVTQEEIRRGEVVEADKRTVTITADSEDLRQFFTRHIDGELFNKAHWRFSRVD